MIHPIIANRSRFLAYWLIWTLLGLVQSMLLYLLADSGIIASLLDGMLSAIIFALISLVIWFPATQMKYDRNNLLMLIINHISISALSILSWFFSVRFLLITILPEVDTHLNVWERTASFRVGTGIFLYIVVILVYYLMISFENIARKNMKEAKLENMLRETELLMLRSQINPHFLFNSLNSVSSLTLTNPNRAREMVIKLSDFMRYALTRKEDQTVPLETELGKLRLYLDIEKVRFGEKLILKEDISDECLKHMVPNMILQPLYENAVKHGVYESVDKVYINLTTKQTDKGILIIISNNFDPDSIPAGGTGTGLPNVRRRLELFYGNRAWIKTVKRLKEFTAELFIPESIDVN